LELRRFPTRRSSDLLSIQFEKTSLYENLDAPRVHFISEYDRLLRNNDKFAADLLATNRIFTLDRAALLANSDMRRTFFDGLQVIDRKSTRLNSSHVK